MLLTIFYMVATWVQSWRLSSLRARLQAILLGPEATRPSIMLYTASQLSVKDETNGNKSKLQNGNNISKDMLSSHLCSNSNLAKLGDLLWYQGDKRLCTIYPQQKVDVSHWLLYPYGKTVFPLFAHNNAQATLQQNAKMHVLIEADLSNYIPLASSKATKLEDYGIIVTWMSEDIFGVILETDLEHITKFSTTLMQGQCFINNGLPVTRIESVSVTGKPCICNYERFNLVESRKLIGSSQWNTYVKKLRLVSSTARLVSQQNEAIEIKEIPGLIVSPGSKPVTLQMPTILEIKIPNDETEDHINSSVPSTPPPTPASATAVINGTASRLSQALTNSMDLSVGSLSNLSSSRSQEFVLEESSQENLSEFTPLKSVKNTKRTSDRDSKMSSVMSSKSSLSTVNYSPRKTELDSKVTKPPNILICADSAVASDNVRSVLDSILKENKYTVYPLSAQEARKDVWMDQASLMIVCGNVGNDVASKVVEFLVHGGKLLALCSDILKTLLPTFKTAEVRENELVRFSYGKWKHVRMMHHVFSNLPESGGKAVFSQIHLEADPSQYEFEESKFLALKQSNATRLEIFSDLLNTHLDIEVNAKPRIPPTYSSGFFLGRHELKLEMLKKLKDKMQPNDVLKTTNLEIQFCGTSTVPKPASSTYLPVMVHRCPDNFSTVEYFENLSTEALGRLVIYADVMTSSNAAINGFALHNGLAVICRSQTKGEGRGKNVWLSPEGCAMFSLQIHIPFNSILGERISLIQHITSVAVVSAVRSIPDYQDIDIRIKWPNDVYTGNGSKLGGTTVTSTIQSPTIICNLGTGINLSNSSPTTCINDMITKYNQATGKKLEKITLERFVALVFNEMEKLINLIQNNNMDEFYDIYYGYWMHTDAEITVILPDGSSQEVKILGVDDYGFLEVQGKNGNIFTVHPDGNSFDILSGLVAPKC
ncbi:hypothetical protein TSAR_010405 [Trichomalopsis sarcophagae]|uniref:BPL/LPL catalytic domain-containing protein n=1 Tax=Trichomalopsis sarcophagae TaxID=543379 RepID=A0A232FCZ8_9HYME|nr:hypothetical protein TSAR_010405 [Trichomalopsis sarcophagae]